MGLELEIIINPNQLMACRGEVRNAISEELVSRSRFADSFAATVFVLHCVPNEDWCTSYVVMA